jgi:HSP20 family molecular chaperone IbpA
MSGERKRDEFKEIEEMIQKILERSLGGPGEELPPGFRIIITGGEIRAGGEHTPLPPSRLVEEPAIEMYEDDGEVKILVEVPGAKEGSTHLQITGKTLRIYADGGKCRYKTSIDLPPVETVSMSYRLINGVLEITFTKSRIVKESPES